MFIWACNNFGLLFVCKVLLVDHKKSKLLLTCKKSLIKSKRLGITEYTQCTRGLVIEGFVASVKPNGLVVVFLNDIKVDETKLIAFLLFLYIAIETVSVWL